MIFHPTPRLLIIEGAFPFLTNYLYKSVFGEKAILFILDSPFDLYLRQGENCDSKTKATNRNFIPGLLQHARPLAATGHLRAHVVAV